MKTEDVLLGLAAGWVIYLLNENTKLKRNTEIVKKQRDGYIDITNQQQTQLSSIRSELNKTIEQSKDLPSDIRTHLQELVRDFEKFDKTISEELISVSALIDINQKPKALFSLAKIIENQLSSICGKGKAFGNMIKEAFDKGILDKKEYLFTLGLKEIRNEEGHELNVKIDALLTSGSFMLAIGMVKKLKTFL